jgi:hypothetical protein
MTQRNFIDLYLATSTDLRPGTWLHCSTKKATYVARIDANRNWSAYEGSLNWSLAKVSDSGYKLPEEKAKEIFPICANLPYHLPLKLVTFRPKYRTNLRAVLNSFEHALVKAGFAELEEFKAQRLRVGLALADALEMARTIESSSINELPQNLNSLIQQMEQAMYLLRPQEEEETSIENSKEVAS